MERTHKAIKLFLFCIGLAAAGNGLYAQSPARFGESKKEFITYPFSDPNPVANPSKLLYPYFRFDGFTNTKVKKEWKIVELENDYIKVTLCPEIGGKVLGAIDKSTGKEFIYQNQVMKFRDIAMRGAWASGGIEFNFGLIGHAPTSSTPVDYLLQNKEDGSASCYVSSYDWLTSTLWTVEINLPQDKAYFTTKTSWHNSSMMNQPYYQWMNAGYKTAGNPQFCFNGTNYIGHSGELSTFPIDEKGNDVSWYKNNNFGNSKSYHVLGKFNDYYGIYWHKDDFGSAHYARYDDKLGMKIFLWGFAREGDIWKDLLTDNDGQYLEMQSGRMFNQPATRSMYSPYKHTEFLPCATDVWTEYWFPVKETRGIAQANPSGSFNLVRENGYLKFYFSPLQQTNTQLKVYDGKQLLAKLPVSAGVFETWSDSIPLPDALKQKKLRCELTGALSYDEALATDTLHRPKLHPEAFDWDSANGQYVQGEQYIRQGMYQEGAAFLAHSLKIDPYYLPALSSMAALCYRQGRYADALEYSGTALSIDAYDAKTNYYYGLACRSLGMDQDAKDGFSIASRSLLYKGAAYAMLAEMHLKEADYARSEYYARRVLDADNRNLTARQILTVVYRKWDKKEQADEIIAGTLKEQPLHHLSRFEKYLQDELPADDFTSLVRCELAEESYLQMAGWYQSVGCADEAIKLLALRPGSPMACYQAAYLLKGKGEVEASKKWLDKALSLPASFVFPFRLHLLDALRWAEEAQPHWKTKYYQALIYWANQRSKSALELLDKCNDSDYAPLFLSRSILKSGEEKRKDIKRAEELDPSWRAGLALINYYNDNKQWAEAKSVGNNYLKKDKSNYYIALQYAQTLCQMGEYQSCVTLLKNTQVLPNEGSFKGREIYREACLHQAVQHLKKKQYKQVVRKVEESMIWLENLGVGKPFDSMIDSRLESFLLAQAYKQMGRKAEALGLWKEIVAYQGQSRFFESNKVLVAKALSELGQTVQAKEYVSSWSGYPQDKIVDCCLSIIGGEKEKALRAYRLYEKPQEVAPWELSFIDPNFNLIASLFLN